MYCSGCEERSIFTKLWLLENWKVLLCLLDNSQGQGLIGMTYWPQRIIVKTTVNQQAAQNGHSQSLDLLRRNSNPPTRRSWLVCVLLPVLSLASRPRPEGCWQTSLYNIFWSLNYVHFLLCVRRTFPVWIDTLVLVYFLTGIDLTRFLVYVYKDKFLKEGKVVVVLLRNFPHLGHGVGVCPAAQGYAGCLLPAGPGGGPLGLSAPAVRLSGLGCPSQGEGAGLRGSGQGNSKRHCSPL